MRDVKKWLAFAAFAASIALSGCVSQSQYKKVQAERDQLRQEAQEAQAEAEDFRNQLGAVSEESAGKDEEITSLSSTNADLQTQLDEINRQYAEALERGSNPLPKALSAELSEFAARNSEVCEFDSSRGLLRFRSDVSFAPGSVGLTPKAREVVNQLAKILNDQGVKRYELMIAGHTDSTPVEHATTIKQGHLDNWYLSAHRAISVGQCLQKCQVGPFRMAMVGYADQRPAASNQDAYGRAKNRRVEVIILPTQAKEVAVEWMLYRKAPAASSNGRSVSRDSNAQTDSGSAFNK
jgi:chemotaxis protein MotB